MLPLSPVRQLRRKALEDELIRILNAGYGHWAVDNLAGREWCCPCDDCAIVKAVWERIGRTKS